MRLRITDPCAVAFDHDVSAVRAEDASGSFGILAGHADFLTALEVSVVAWRTIEGAMGYCAVRNGIFAVTGGNVMIATREAHVGDDLDRLEGVVLAGYRQHVESERMGRTMTAKLRMQAIRRMVEALRGGPAEIGL